MISHSSPDVRPWYREPWPWLLMAGPAIVVVAGFATLAFAVQSYDGLVADDYYQQGKAINMTMRRDLAANALGYRAAVDIDTDRGRAVVTFAGPSPSAPTLTLGLRHPTRGGMDREIVLGRNADGTYAAAFPALPAGRWGWVIEDAGRAWRLTGDLDAGARRVAPRQPN